MPSTILSDNGVSSGTSGIKTTGSNDGALALQTTTAGGTATTAISIDTSQNVTFAGAVTNPAGTVSAPSITFTGDTNTGIFSPGADITAFTTGGTERGRFTAAGYFKASSDGTYISAAGSYHEMRQTIAAGEGLLVSHTSTSQTAGTLEAWSARNTTNNSYYALSYYNSGAAAYRFRVADSGSIATVGGIALGTATAATSGIGVQFPATQSASSDANTLDDYEEGNWTPTAAGSSGSLTSYTSNGTYTKIGDLVFVRGRILLTNVGTAGGALNAGGLPFTTSNGVRPFVGVCREDEFTGNGYLTWATTSGTTFTINTFTNGAITWTNNYAYVFSATYKAA